MSKQRGENWDPKQVKVVVAELKKIRKEQIEAGAAPRKAKKRTASQQARAKKAIGQEPEKIEAHSDQLNSERIVTKNDALRRQLNVQLNPSRFRR